MIIQWTQNVPFNDPRDVIIRFLTNVLGVDDDGNDNQPMLGAIFSILKTVQAVKMTFSNV